MIFLSNLNINNNNNNNENYVNYIFEEVQLIVI